MGQGLPLPLTLPRPRDIASSETDASLWGYFPASIAPVLSREMDAPRVSTGKGLIGYGAAQEGASLSLVA